MKLLHVADLHIGKRVNGLSMIDEQRNAIDQIVSIAEGEGVAGVLVAGDVFDRPIPSREALEVCEQLFSRLTDAGIPVFVVPGNHDSPQQLAFCSMLLESAGLHIAKAFDGTIDRHVIEEDGERACIHLLPFVRPTDVRMALPDHADQVSSHEDAVRVALSQDELDPHAVNVLVAHQFVTASGSQPQTCDSELISVGGSDNVDASVFDAYDYVALGHLHGPQYVGREEVRYSGSPLMYSFSEVSHRKGVTLLTIEGGSVSIEERPITPLHRMREITASYEDLLDGADTGDSLDYMRVTLVDRSLPDAMAKLRIIYPNILRLDWQFLSDAPARMAEQAPGSSALDPLELFSRYYLEQTSLELTAQEQAIVAECIEEVQR